MAQARGLITQIVLLLNNSFHCCLDFRQTDFQGRDVLRDIAPNPWVLRCPQTVLLCNDHGNDVGPVRGKVRGSQYLSIRYTERLGEAGIEPSVGSVGDSYDNALAETINGLFKAEVIHRRGPWRSFEAVEYATLEWVDWFNHRRLLEPIGNIPPAEAKANYHTALETPTMTA